MDIDDLQSEVRRLIEGIEHPRVGAALALGEECGEILRCVLEQEYYGADKRADLQGEVGDVLIALAEICDRYELSLGEAARGAIAKLEQKAPGWREELGDRLLLLRRRMDGVD